MTVSGQDGGSQTGRPCASALREPVARPGILIIEDEPFIQDFLRLGLRPEGFEVYAATNGEAGLKLFSEHTPALVILDLRLPDLDGEEVCHRLRARADVPILVLTARDEVPAKVKLFQLGADDYVVKPFDFDELLARIHALLRRTASQGKAGVLRFLDLELRTDTREVLRGGGRVELTAKEFDLLHLFLTNAHRVLTKELILDRVWGFGYDGDSNIVEVYVSHLRRKLGEPPLIQTMRGIGYTLREAP